MLDQKSGSPRTHDDVAHAFVAARRNATALADYPGAPPQSFADAYAIQDRAITLDGRAVGGWKVGRVGDLLAGQLGTDRLAGPIFADTIVEAATGNPVAMPVFAGGFAAVEAELLFRVVRAPDRDPARMSDAEILALCDAVHVGIEIASSPFAGINAMGPLVTASDFGNNAGLIIGPPLPDWQGRDLAAVEAETLIDGASVGKGTLANLPGGPIGSVRFLIANLGQRGLSGSGPYWISSGAISGVHVIAPGSHAEARFDGGLTLACQVVAAAARS